MLDELLQLLSTLSQQIFPILLAVLLVYVIYFVKKLVDVLKATEITIKTSNKTIETVDEQLQKLDAPLNAIENLSHTVDDANETARKVGGKLVQQLLHKFTSHEE